LRRRGLTGGPGDVAYSVVGDIRLQRGTHIFVDVGRNPVVAGDIVIRKVGLQLLRRGVILNRRVFPGRVVPSVGVLEEKCRIVLRLIVVLMAGTITIAIRCRGAGKEIQRHCSLAEGRAVSVT
jgi:hypothetical protein